MLYCNLTPTICSLRLRPGGGDVDPPLKGFLTDQASVGDLLQSKLLAEIVQIQVEKIC